jgi:hypothetical protein
MNLFLAESSAEQAGYVVGVLMGIVFFLGILALAIIAIVQAFSKKTPGWIAVGSLGGVVVLIPIVIFVVGFARGVTKAVRSRQGMENGSGALSAAGNSGLGGSQTIRGQEIAYSIKIPADWNIQRRHEAFDLLAHHRSLYIGVIAEEANLGNPQAIADIARERIGRIGAEIQWTDSTPVELDGRSWLRFTVNCKVQMIPLSYQFYVYAGAEGTFQIISWTMQTFAGRDTPQMNEVSQTFRFPK